MNTSSPTRYATVIGVREDKLDFYKKLHAEAWPEILKQIRKHNIRNYSIYLRKMPDGKHYLFSYFEYTGTDFDADMAQMATDPTSQRWWAECRPCQEPLANRKGDEWWSPLEEIFHTD